jgi:hypothetical protein
MVCHLTDQPVMTLSCRHKICLDDLRGYVTAALGNISLFPIKCPLSFNNCPGTILPREAKRVLTASQYLKFCEFSDRSEYGEGIRCLFCNYYILYPSNHTVAMVECPSCLQRCCINCKKPWHYGQRCPLEVLDDSLDEWKRVTGAQKCPTCLKIIEKDDPATCHHMVHKSTDGIPCSRDRTDFCCEYPLPSLSLFSSSPSRTDLCGLEVASEYPHDEVTNPGINHFPDGVFQNCRTILVREREIEREKLRKAKRMKKAQSALRSKSNVSVIVPVESDQDWGTATIRSSRSAPALSLLTSSDPFDVAWSQTLSGASSPYQQQSVRYGGIEIEEDDEDEGEGDEV